MPLQIGTQRFAVAAAVHEEPMFSGEAGLLGNGLLSKFCLTIDAPGNWVIFERNRYATRGRPLTRRSAFVLVLESGHVR